jgi:serine carboxypeptidase 1
MMMKIVVAVCLFLLQTSDAESADNESSGFLDIRPDASIFYWLMRASNETHEYTSFPLVISLAGGPGLGSSGSSNMQRIGPVDTKGQPRNSTWLHHANLLFIDFPVGSGYSHVRVSGNVTVQNNSGYVSSIDQMGTDFVAKLKLFLLEHPEFQSIPSYIFGESYGSRYAVAAADQISKLVDNNEISFNLKGIGLGGACIDIKEQIKSWPEMLHAYSFINEHEKQVLYELVDEMNDAAQKKDYMLALTHFGSFSSMTDNFTENLYVYNILEPKTPYDYPDDLMNSQAMRDKLGIPDNVTYKTNRQVKTILRDDHFVSLTDIVERLLNETYINVAVYTGQFDLITSAMGNERWVNRLAWKGSQKFLEARKTVYTRDGNGFPQVYRKWHGNLLMYTIMKSGHQIPIDQPQAAIDVLLDVMLGA